MGDGLVDFLSGAPTSGTLDVKWIHGARSSRRSREPTIQVHHYEEHTVILRQSKSVHFEAPFLFLLFGNERALLLDTGATADPARFPLREVVDRLVDRWLARHPRDGYGLVVAHTHGHHDHVAADGQFSGRPRTTIVPHHLDGVRTFFGFDRWPAQTVAVDLGGRVLEVLGSPGHHEAAVTVYDPWTGFLLTGDTVLPGRLYAVDFPAFLASLDRMVALTAERPVTHVLGCHVEMTCQPGRDYPLWSRYQPDERALQLSPAQLTEIRDAAGSIAGERGAHRFDDAIIYNEPRVRDQVRLMARGLMQRLLARW